MCVSSRPRTQLRVGAAPQPSEHLSHTAFPGPRPCSRATSDGREGLVSLAHSAGAPSMRPGPGTAPKETPSLSKAGPGGQPALMPVHPDADLQDRVTLSPQNFEEHPRPPRSQHWMFAEAPGTALPPASQRHLQTRVPNQLVGLLGSSQGSCRTSTTGVSNLLASLGHTLNTRTLATTDEQKQGLCVVSVTLPPLRSQEPHVTTLDHPKHAVALWAMF